LEPNLAGFADTNKTLISY